MKTTIYYSMLMAFIVCTIIFLSYGFHPSKANRKQRQIREIKNHQESITIDQKLNSIEHYIKKNK